MTGSFCRNSHTTAVTRQKAATTNIERMNRDPNQSSIWPRSSRISRAAEPIAIRPIPTPSTRNRPLSSRTDLRSCSNDGVSWT